MKCLMKCFSQKSRTCICYAVLSLVPGIYLDIDDDDGDDDITFIDMRHMLCEALYME